MEKLREFLPKRSSCSTGKTTRRHLLLLSFIFLWMLMPGTGVADKTKPMDGDAGSADRIHITADKLVAESKANTAEFIGNVRATQENTIITSDRLKVFYDNTSEGNEKDAGSLSIDRIVASGNVTILMDDKKAVSEQAVYLNKTDVLILTGANSTITSEKNSVSGNKITLYRKDDRMVVDSSSDKKVEVILYTKGKGLR